MYNINTFCSIILILDEMLNKFSEVLHGFKIKHRSYYKRSSKNFSRIIYSLYGRVIIRSRKKINNSGLKLKRHKSRSIIFLR